LIVWMGIAHGRLPLQVTLCDTKRKDYRIPSALCPQAGVILAVISKRITRGVL